MNLFSISNIILSLSSLLFGLIIYRSNRDNKLMSYWLMFAWCFSFWSLGLFGVTYYQDYNLALFWQYILDFFAVFLPATYVVFLIKFFKIENKIWIPLIFTASIIFSIFSFTPYFKTGLEMQNGLYWIAPGQYYYLFVIYFGLYAVISVCLLFYQLKINWHNELVRGQIRNIIISSLFGYIGGSSNFFPYMFKSFPYGNYFVIFFLVFMVYGVLKYKILNTKVVSAQIFSIAIILISLFNFLRSESIKDQIITGLTLLLISLFSYLLIRSVNEEVEIRNKVEALVKNLEKANLKLKELDQKKSEFMSLATHQLRAPLTSMRGYSSMILDGTFGKVNNPEVEDAIDKISRASTDLAMIVEDYLNISRIEQGRMQYNFSIFNLSDLIKDILKEVKPTMDHAGLAVNFIYDEAVQYRVNVDQGKIKQVLFNIIDNAIKYTPTGHIDIILSVKDVNKVLVKIQDTGVGINPDILPTLFKKFKRAPDASKTNILGTGLGLYVANEILKAHNATAWAESEGQGKGSSFYVELGMMS